MVSLIIVRLKALRKEWLTPVTMTGMALLFTYIFGISMNQDVKPTMFVVDEDQTTLTQTFLMQLKEWSSFDIEEQSSIEKGRENLEKNQGLVALVLPKGFTTTLGGDRELQLKMITGQQSPELITFQHEVRAILGMLLQKESDAIPDAFKDQAEAKSEEASKMNTRVLNSLIGFTLFFSTFTSFYTINDLLQDKKLGVFARMMVSPMEAWQYILGNLIFTWGLGFAQMAVIMFCGIKFFNLQYGTYWPLIMMIYAFFSFTMTSLGLFVVSISKSQVGIGSITPVILVSCAMLGGCMWPITMVTNKVVRGLGDLTPHRWATLPIQRLITTGSGVEEAYIAMAVLFGMGLLYLALATRGLKRHYLLH